MTQKKLIITGICLILFSIAFTGWAARRSSIRICHNQHKLAQIEHTLVRGMEAQGKELVKKGFTFGIPKQELPKLIKESNKRDKEFLAELDQLASSDCSII
jgi:hypothetical protein